MVAKLKPLYGVLSLQFAQEQKDQMASSISFVKDSSFQNAMFDSIFNIGSAESFTDVISDFFLQWVVCFILMYPFAVLYYALWSLPWSIYAYSSGFTSLFPAFFAYASNRQLSAEGASIMIKKTLFARGFFLASSFFFFFLSVCVWVFCHIMVAQRTSGFPMLLMALVLPSKPAAALLHVYKTCGVEYESPQTVRSSEEPTPVHVLSTRRRCVKTVIRALISPSFGLLRSRIYSRGNPFSGVSLETAGKYLSCSSTLAFMRRFPSVFSSAGRATETAAWMRTIFHLLLLRGRLPTVPAADPGPDHFVRCTAGGPGSPLAALLAAAPVPRWFSSPSPSPEGDEKDGMLPRVSSKDAEKKVAIKTGGEGEDGSNDDTPNESPDEIPVTERLIFLYTSVMWIFLLLSAIFWYMASPKGPLVGWATLKERALDIDRLVVHPTFVQVYLSGEKAMKACVGLASSEHTHAKVQELKSAYNAARQKSLSFWKKDENGEPHPESLPVVISSRKWSETALRVVAFFAFLSPFILFPIAVGAVTSSQASAFLQKLSKMPSPATKNASSFVVEAPSSTRFMDVAGMKEPKQEITEIVDFLRNPKRYTDLGAKIPKGALLLGPPGTGKTLLAKAVSGESGVSFIATTGSDFMELYAGTGAKRVRELFELASKQRCIIYIDEIDAIGLKRKGAGHGEKQEQEHTLNELLTQLDGFDSENRSGDIVLLASSNVPLESLDSALVRPGRFDRIIHVDSPVRKERVEVFKVHLSKLKLVLEPDNLGPTQTNEEAEHSHTQSIEGAAAEPTSATSISIENSPPSASSAEAESQCAAFAVGQMEKAEAVEASKPLSNVTALVPVGPAMTADEFIQRMVTSHGAEKKKTPEPFFMVSLKSKEEQQLIQSYAERMSDLCPGFVGSDIANVCNEAAIRAAREGSRIVTISHLEKSIDRVIAGVEHRSRALSDFERKVVAHHEAGHAVAGWFLRRASPLMKVSMVPRGGSALGYAQYLPNENKNMTAKELRDSISVSLGGRIAEEIFFQHLSTGASDDLKKVQHMAYLYVSSFAGNLNAVYPTPGSDELKYRKPYGVEKANEYDRQAQRLVDEIYKETYDLLLRHKEQMEVLANHLLTEEVLTHHDVVQYLGVRQGRDNDRKPLREVFQAVSASASLHHA
eukprot:gene3653-2588_t